MLPHDYLKEGQIQLVKYTKSNGEVSERIILPLHVPTNVKALDLSGLTVTELKQYKTLFDEYQEYVETRKKLTNSFEEWLDWTRPNHNMAVKFRAFKPEGLDLPD